MKKLIDFLLPKGAWVIPAIIISTAILGLGIYILNVSKATSYLSDDPKTCINCHVMVPEYNTWMKSSHKNVATCNDCHVPHDNIFKKYFFKAADGARHATIFTLGTEPQSIKMHEAGQEVVKQNCIRCHQNQIQDDKLFKHVKNPEIHTGDRNCWECHREVPHSRVKSLSSTPYGQVPTSSNNIVPDWMKEKLKDNSVKE